MTTSNPLSPQVTSNNSITLTSKFRRLLVNVSGCVGGVGGLTVIIGLVSVQVTLKLELPTGTELGKKHTK